MRVLLDSKFCFMLLQVKEAIPGMHPNTGTGSGMGTTGTGTGTGMTGTGMGTGTGTYDQTTTGSGIAPGTGGMSTEVRTCASEAEALLVFHAQLFCIFVAAAVSSFVLLVETSCSFLCSSCGC